MSPLGSYHPFSHRVSTTVAEFSKRSLTRAGYRLHPRSPSCFFCHFCLQGTGSRLLLPARNTASCCLRKEVGGERIPRAKWRGTICSQNSKSSSSPVYSSLSGHSQGLLFRESWWGQCLFHCSLYLFQVGYRYMDGKYRKKKCIGWVLLQHVTVFKHDHHQNIPMTERILSLGAGKSKLGSIFTPVLQTIIILLRSSWCPTPFKAFVPRFGHTRMTP